MECIRKLCDAIDTDFDDRITVEELRAYIQLKELPFEDSIPEQMFEEAISGRGYINEAQRMAPLSHEEVAATVRGRHRYNPEWKEWEI
jgi:Ca2+-binding EF-hand superfamily protein